MLEMGWGGATFSHISTRRTHTDADHADTDAENQTKTWTYTCMDTLTHKQVAHIVPLQHVGERWGKAKRDEAANRDEGKA